MISVNDEAAGHVDQANLVVAERAAHADAGEELLEVAKANQTRSAARRTGGRGGKSTASSRDGVFGRAACDGKAFRAVGPAVRRKGRTAGPASPRVKWSCGGRAFGSATRTQHCRTRDVRSGVCLGGSGKERNRGCRAHDRQGVECNFRRTKTHSTQLHSDAMRLFLVFHDDHVKVRKMLGRVYGFRIDQCVSGFRIQDLDAAILHRELRLAALDHVDDVRGMRCIGTLSPVFAV